MPITLARARRHIDEHIARLGPIRANWPANLFHAAHVTSAASIIENGYVLARSQQEAIIHDVANQGALGNNRAPHAYARLYFRPKTMFHMRTEGIKCKNTPYRLPNHMSVPVLFAFDAALVLIRDGTRFTRRNAAKSNEPLGDDEVFFNSIEFGDVYHDSAPPTERGEEIRERRMAEVLVPDRLPLEGFLSKIIVRTALDRRTLISHLSVAAREKYAGKIVQEQNIGSCFLHKGLYITSIERNSAGLLMEFHQPHELPGTNRYCGEIRQICSGRIASKRTFEWEHVRGKWKFSGFPASCENEEWEIYLEDVLAFKGSVSSVGSQLV